MTPAASPSFAARPRRPAVLILAAFILISPAAAQQAPKRPLTHNDYDCWRTITSPQLSRDGKYLAYALTPQDGDGEFIVRNLTTGEEWRFPRGSRAEAPAAPPATGGRGQRGGGFATGATGRSGFTADGRYVAFPYSPAKVETEQAKKDKKKPEEMPRGGMAIVDLKTGKLKRIERVRNFQIPEDGAGYLAYQMEAKREAGAPEERRPETPPTGRPSRRRPGGAPATTPAQTPRRPEFGSDLVLYNLASGSTRVIPDVLDYSFCKDGKLLAYTVSAKQKEANGVYAVTPGAAGPPLPLLAGKGKYTRLVWDEKQTQLAFLSDRDDAGAKVPKYKLYLWDRKTGVAAAQHWNKQLYLTLLAARGPQLLGWAGTALQGAPTGGATELASTATPGFRAGWVIGERGLLSFSQDGGRLFLSVTRPPDPPKEAAKDAAPADEKVVVDLWHWKDDYIQPMQKVRAEQDRNRAYRAVVHLKDRKFVQLADEALADVNPSADGRLAVGYDDRPYRRLVGFDANYSDAYLIDTATGVRKPILKKHSGTLSWSPTGKYLLYFDGKNWNCLRTADGKVTNLTKPLAVSFAVEDVDTPSTPPPYGSAGWTADEKFALLYDRYDVWQVAPDGKARNLTGGVGRKEKTQLRYLSLDPQERHVNPAKPLLLRAENQETHDAGFYRVRFDNGAPEKLLMAPKSFGFPSKAKNADVVLLTASTFCDFPDLHVTTTAFQNLVRVSDANPQKANFTWGTAELVHYKNLNGVPLRGVLLKPENFDPHRKYPLMVYIYERLSQNLHHFVVPRQGTSINPTYYVSNGYLVLMPDIVYTVGYPGQSALKCVLPAVQAVVDRGCVNENAIGIQGHSWGGYQIAYMITQTNRFKAVAAGAPVANMTSAYDGIRWGSGLPRQFQYERTQSRIGGSLWQYPMRFIENSPIFMADRVQTPLLMLHNDQDDAVPWYQGIEYFLALRRLGKEVYLFNYNGEPHGLRKKANQRDYTVRMQQYFDHFLKGAPAPAWMVKGVPYLERDKINEKAKPAPTTAKVGGG